MTKTTTNPLAVPIRHTYNPPQHLSTQLLPSHLWDAQPSVKSQKSKNGIKPLAYPTERPWQKRKRSNFSYQNFPWRRAKLIASQQSPTTSSLSANYETRTALFSSRSTASKLNTMKKLLDADGTTKQHVFGLSHSLQRVAKGSRHQHHHRNTIPQVAWFSMRR